MLAYELKPNQLFTRPTSPGLVWLAVVPENSEEMVVRKILSYDDILGWTLILRANQLISAYTKVDLLKID